MPIVPLSPGAGAASTPAGNPLIGDLILDCRVLGPDLPQTSGVPAGISAAVASVSSGSLAVGTYQTKRTNLTNWGETLPDTETAVIITGAGQSIQVSGTLPAGITGGRIYLSVAAGVAGSEQQFYQYSSLPATVDSTKLVGGAVPTKSSAWLADTDGSFLPASVLYAWMRDALEQASQITGGIVDRTGVPSVVGQPMYLLPNRWSELSDVWYDGYWINRGTRKDNYYRSGITALSWNATLARGFQQRTIELFPQPQRTAGTGTLSGALAVGDTTANVTFTTPSTGFTLTLGIARIGGVGGELVYYQGTTTTTLTGLTRGFGGTVATAYASGAAVDECNLMAQGKRYPIVPLLGQSGNALDIPAGWYGFFHQYMMYRYRLLEQQHAEAKDLLAQFTAGMNQWAKSTKQFSGPKQAGGPAGIEVFNYNQATGHGWVTG